MSSQKFKRKKINTNLTDQKSTKPFRSLPETMRNKSKVEISEHKRVEERLGKLNECFLSFETNPDENINRLVALCGEELGATCALYNRLKDGLLHSVGQWNTPPDYISVDKPDGHICYGLIQSGQKEVYVIRNLPQTIYAQTDPNVMCYGLKTYIGKTVSFGGTTIGSLCVVYQKDYIPNEDDKKFLEIIAFAIGVEEKRKGAEETLRQSEERYRTILDNIEDSYYEVDLAGNITFFNDSVCRDLGYSKKEMIGMNNRQYMDKDNAKKVYQVFNQIYTTGEPYKAYDWEIIRKDGTKRIHESSVSLLRNAKGERIGFRGIARDITERKRAEEEYRTVVRTAMDGFWIVDMQGRFLDVNDAYCRLIGYSRDKLLTMRISDVEAVEKPEETARRIQKIMEVGGDRFETHHKCKDGRIIDIEVSVNYMEVGGGRMFVFLRDITERKRSEEAIRRSEEEAKQLSQENGVVAEIGRIITSTLNIEEVYERFAEEVRKLLPWDGIAINLINPQEHTITVAYSTGVEIPERFRGETYPLAATMTEEILRGRSSLLIQPNDSEELAKRFPQLSLSIREKFKSFLSVPLISKDQVIAVLHFRSLKANSYTEMDLRLAERVGNQIAGAIANAQLFKEREQVEEALQRSEEGAKRIAQENGVVAEIGRIITSTLNIEEVYERFAEEVRKLIPFERIAISILNPEEHTFAIAYTSGVEIPERRQGVVLSLAGTATEECMRTRSSLLFQPESIDEVVNRFPGLLPTFKAGLHSMIFVPLISKDQVIGVLFLRATKPNAYTEGDLRLIERVGNQIAGTIANAQLFAERVRAEEALHTEKQRFQTLSENAPFGMVMIDKDGTFKYLNPKFTELLGYELNDVPDGKTWFRKAYPNPTYRHDVIATWINDLNLKSFEPGEKKSETFTVTCKDGTEKIVNFKPVQLETGELLMACEDITERKRMVQEKAALEEQLRQSQRIEAIGRLAGGIAHDFNNLLTVIKGYSELLLIKLKEGDPLKGNIEEIHRASQRATDLTRQLLAFSRRQILEFKVLDLNTILQDMDKMLRRLLSEDIELVTLFAEGIGKVRTDPGQIEQVILNLVVNARDAMPSGGKLTIETANVELDETYAHTHIEMKPGRYVMLSVSDTGCGMSPEVKEHLFEPFFTTKEKGKGTGLGLSTVYGIVKQSEGDVWVYSEPGQGTAFKIYLPRVEEEGITLPHGDDKDSLPRGRETVLLVEDELSVRGLAVQVLRENGYNLLEAANGIEALRMAQEYAGEIHLLLTDVVMPQMGGKELADRLKPLRPGIKVLFTSGYTDNAIVHHGVLEPGIDFLQKPFSPITLAQKVRKVLDR
jgi:PAS domain S-box-containing protein